jgi:hypothetical protein
MEKQSAIRRIIVPAIPVLSAMIISINVYDLSMKITPGTLKTAVVSVMIMFASVWLGPLLANSLAFFRGASFPERMLVSLITPAVWIAKTYGYFIGIYSFGELVYLILHPFILGNIGVNLLCIGISELACRGRLRSRGGDIPLFASGNTAVLVAGAVIAFAGLWNGGHTYYYYYMDVYSWLFL